MQSTTSRTNQELVDATSEGFPFQLHGSACVTGTTVSTSWGELGFVQLCGDDTHRHKQRDRGRSQWMQHGTATDMECDSLNDLHVKYLVIHKTGKSCLSERLWDVKQNTQIRIIGDKTSTHCQCLCASLKFRSNSFREPLPLSVNSLCRNVSDTAFGY